MILTIYIMANNLAGPVFAKLGAYLKGLPVLMRLATAASLGLGAGLAAIGGITVKLASDFQTQMAKISGLTGSSAEQVDYYRQQILKLSPAWDLSAVDASKALYFIISAGYSGAKAIDILGYSAKTATATLGDQAQVADAMTSMMNAYKDANVSASEAANDLIKIVTYGKANMSAFASTLGFTYVTARAAGLSMEEASAAMATLSQVAGEHGIRRMDNDLNNLMRSMLSIDDVSKRSAAQLKAMGIDDAQTFQAVNTRAQDMGLTFDKLKYASLDFIGRLKYLAEISGYSADQYNSSRSKMILTQYGQIQATKGEAAAQAWLNMQQMEGSARFEKLIGGAAAFIPALSLLADHSSEYAMILGKMKDKTDVVTNAFNTMRGTVNQQLKMLEIRFQNIGIAIGLHLLPYVSMFLKGLMGLLEPVTQFVGTSQGIDTLKYSFIGLALVIGGPLTAAVWSLVAPILPFLAMLAALTAAGILLGRVLQAHPEILRAVQRGWQDFWNAAQPILRFLQSLLTQVGDAFRRTFQDPALQTALQNLWNDIQPLLPTLQQVGTVLGGAVLISLIATSAALIFLANILPGLVEMWTGWLTILIGVGRVLFDLVTLNYKDIPAAFKQVSEGMQETVKGWTDFATGAANGWKAATKFTQDATAQLQHLGVQQQTDRAKTQQAMTVQQAQADAARLQQQIASEQQQIAALQQAANKETDIHKRTQLEIQIAKLAFDQESQQDQLAADQAMLGLLHVHLQHVQQVTAQHVAAQQARRQQALQRDAEGLNHHHQQVVTALTQHYAQLAAKRVGADAAELAEARQHYAALHGLAQWFYNLMHPAHAKAINQHKAQTDAAHKALEAAAKAHYTTSATQASHAATTLVTQHATQLQAGAAVTAAATQTGITQPVQTQMTVLHDSLKDSGKNLVQMIAADITAHAPKMGQAAKGAFDQIKGWLGFGSPPPNAPEAALWGIHAMQMVATSVRSGYTLLAAAAEGGYNVMAGQFAPPIAAGVNGGVGGLAGQTPLVGGGSHTVTITHNWNGAFPGVKASDEIVAAVRKVQQEDYRLSRRPGYVGTRAPIGS